MSSTAHDVTDATTARRAPTPDDALRLAASSKSGPVLSADGTPLRISLARALRRQKIRALVLIAPLLIFILVAFVFPIGDMLFRSIENGVVPETLPKTTAALGKWDPASGQLPGEDVYAALHEDLVEAVNDKTNTVVGARLNYEKSGMSSLFRKARRVVQMKPGDYKAEFIKLDEQWGNVDTWRVIKQNSGFFTANYFLAAMDLQHGPDGLELKPDYERIYLKLFARTFLLSVAITVLTALLGYPVAFLLAELPMRKSSLLMIMVLLPFWTSLLVRTSAWIVLLQQQGVINDILVNIGIISEGNRLQMMFNAIGTVVAMTHILLPFMILPLYSVMKTIPASYVRAAKSLGANDWTAFWRVYFPNSVPGIGAGSILVFILAVGYYITPELVGGTSGIFISNRIAYNISTSLNWGLAAALGVILLFVVMVLYYVYDRIVGISNVKLG